MVGPAMPQERCLRWKQSGAEPHAGAGPMHKVRFVGLEVSDHQEAEESLHRGHHRKVATARGVS